MSLSKQARDARNAYQREWRKKNREKAKYHANLYWERKAQAQKAQEGAK